MNPLRVYITGRGVLSALGKSTAETYDTLATGCSRLGPLTRFTPPHTPPLPVGEIEGLTWDRELPESHHMARLAADQAMTGCSKAPDAVILGVTTGGLSTTEDLLKEECNDPVRYRNHAIGSVAEDLARRYHCKGPVITVSTACSSGACAIALSLAMLRGGNFNRILTGGVDSLCRLTYYGFKSLQLIDPDGARPFSHDRRGMSVAEGAGMILLEASTKMHEGMELLGAGLSCDAHHPTQPHPRGDGAASAMHSALGNAGLQPDDIDYINLHGTGTPDNDRSEAIAIKTVFGEAPPPLSSVKGAMGHPLAAAGAIEAVIATLSIENGLVPGNTGAIVPDPELGLSPVGPPISMPVRTVLSNSFGFGGNNATLIVGQRRECPESTKAPSFPPFVITGWAAVTGAGHTANTLERLRSGQPCTGKLDEKALCEGLPPRDIRRLKRLSQMALALSNGTSACDNTISPSSIYFGTAWGSLSETADFLEGLFASEEKFSSPTDFIGSVHNAPAGQIALKTHATGPNITVSGGDTSFEQALFSAHWLTRDDKPVLVAGADEGHEKLSPLFDPSVSAGGTLSDGGGAFMLQRGGNASGPLLRLLYFMGDWEEHVSMEKLVDHLGGPDSINQRYEWLLAGIPAVDRNKGQDRLSRFLDRTTFNGRVIDYRLLTGEYGAASAVAAVLAASLVDIADPNHKGALIIGFGKTPAAMEVMPS